MQKDQYQYGTQGQYDPNIQQQGFPPHFPHGPHGPPPPIKCQNCGWKFIFHMDLMDHHLQVIFLMALMDHQLQVIFLMALMDHHLQVIFLMDLFPMDLTDHHQK